MTIEKIYRSLTKGEIGVYVGTEVDKTDGRIMHILNIKHEDGTTEERHVAESTFKRWWKLVEEVTAEDLEESVESLNKIKDSVTLEQPTIGDLKQLNESGVELTEEELQLFEEQTQEQIQKEAETIEAVLELQKEDTTTEKVKEHKAPKENDVWKFFEQTVYDLGGSIKLYSEPAKRVVNNSIGKPVIFYMVGPKGVKLHLKEALDETIKSPVTVEEKHTYPQQFPFRLQVSSLDTECKELLTNILKMHI